MPSMLDLFLLMGITLLFILGQSIAFPFPRNPGFFIPTKKKKKEFIVTCTMATIQGLIIALCYASCLQPSWKKGDLVNFICALVMVSFAAIFTAQFLHCFRKAIKYNPPETI